MANFLVNLAGLALMAAVVWWFWLAPAKSAKTGTSSDPVDHSQH